MKISRERILLLVLLAAVIAVWWAAWGEVSDELTITVLDVGQGDCILVQAPGGRTMLVDGGGWQGRQTEYDVGREVVTPALLARAVSRIDVLVITHPHEDHVGGLPAVVEAVPVGMVLDPMLESDSESYKQLKELVEERKIPMHRAAEGQHINLGRGIYAQVLSPPDPRLEGTGAELNDNSVVLRIVYGDESVLLAGDVERAGARRLAGMGAAIRSTVLKVPHHGSSGPAVPTFIQAVSPKLAVISVGEENTFGHPSDEMLRELDHVEAKIMRTDMDGAVTVKIEPPRWWARGMSPRGRSHRLSGAVAAAGASE
jgi:competence protein ComEC